MNPSTVKRVKAVWAATGLCVIAFAFLRWGLPAAVAATVAFAGFSLLAFVAYFLFLLLGDAPLSARVLLIALFLVGVLVELGAIAALVDYLTGGALGWADGS